MLHAAWLVCLSVSVVDKLHHIPGDLHLHIAGSWGVVMLSVCVSVERGNAACGVVGVSVCVCGR